MSRISSGKMARIARSGMTFYRVWGYAGLEPRSRDLIFMPKGTQQTLKVDLRIDTYHFCGKRKLKHVAEIGSGAAGDYHVFQRRHKVDIWIRRNIFDSWGDKRSTGDGALAWFTSRRSAERFVQEVNDGLHPWAVFRLQRHHEMCDDLENGWASMMNEEYYKEPDNRVVSDYAIRAPSDAVD